MGADAQAAELAALILDQELFAEAERVISDGGGDLLALLRARRLVEARWPDGLPLPAGAGYERAAAVLAETGHARQAAVLAGMARTENWRQASASRWDHRYEGPLDEASTGILAEANGATLDLAAARRGIDGALYQAGTHAGRGDVTVVLVRTRAGCELVTGWDSPLAAQAWVQNRQVGTEAPLSWPPNAAASRVVREEQVLAFLLRYPWQADAVARVLHGHQFGADVRDEIYSSVKVVARRGGAVTAATVGDEVGYRYAWAPSWAQAELGGPDVPWAAAYLRRLARAEVSPVTALTAASELAGPWVLPDTGTTGSAATRPPAPVAAPQVPHPVQHRGPPGPQPRM